MRCLRHLAVLPLLLATVAQAQTIGTRESTPPVVAATTTTSTDGTNRSLSVPVVATLPAPGSPAGGTTQGSTTSGQTGTLSLCAVVTGNQPYTAGQTQPCNLTPTGRLKVGLSAATNIAPALNLTTTLDSELVGCLYRASPPAWSDGWTGAVGCDSFGSQLFATADSYVAPAAMSAALNTAYSVALGRGQGTVAFAITGLTASGATLTAQYSDDKGANWYPLRNIGTATVPGATTFTTDGPISFTAGGHTNLRLIVTTAGTGNITIGSNASVPARGVNLEGAGTASTNPLYATVTQSGSPWGMNLTQVGGAAVTLGQKTQASSIPVTLASDGSYATAANQTGAGASAQTIQGSVPSGAADAGNPIKIGGYASSSAPTAVTAGQRVNAWLLLNGAQASATVGATGNVAAVDANGNQSFVIANGTNTFNKTAPTLGANAHGYLGYIDLGSATQVAGTAINVTILSPTAGTIAVSYSDDGNTPIVYDQARTVTANTALTYSVPIFARYFLIDFLNGATAQGSATRIAVSVSTGK